MPPNDGETGSPAPGAAPVTILEMNWPRAIKIWWYWAWRTMLMALIAGLVVGVLAGIFLFPFVGSQTAITSFVQVIGWAIGMVLGIWVLKSVPEKRFSDFRVVLIARDREQDDG